MASLGRKGASAALTSADIPDNSITAAKIVDGTITVGDIGTNAVGTDEIANDAVTGGKLANDIAISTSGAITTTGAFTSIGIDDDATSTAITIDANENVGIGITPKSWYSTITALQIAPTGALYNTSNWEDFSIACNSYYDSGGTESYIQTDAACKIRLTDSGLMDFKVAASGSADAAITWITAMAIDSSGGVSIGASASSTRKLLIGGSGTTSSTYQIFTFNSAGADGLWVRDDGVAWIKNAWTTSDRRHKENISYVTDDILPKIEQLKFAKYDLIDSVKNCYGFISQDVETIFPDCVDDTVMPDKLYELGDEIPEGKEIGDIKKEGGEQKNLNYTYVFSYLVKAVQELSAKVTALENA